MVHRAVLGSYERFIALLLEQFKGILPIWLSPVQINIIPINKKYHEEYCLQIKERLLEEDIRVEYDGREESLRKKIRESNLLKNPYTLIIGDKEKESKKVSYRKLGSEENVNISLEEFVIQIKKECRER